MKIKITSLIIITLLIIITIFFLSFPKDVMDSVTFSISIWKDSLLPSLFPFFIITELLIQYGFVEIIGELSKNIMSNLFHLPGEASFVVVGSLISGFPSSSKYINELLVNNQINEDEASYLLKFNHFSNPLFVIGTIGTLLLNNKNIGIIILIVHIITNFIIALLFRPKTNKYKKEKVSIVNAINRMYKKRINNNLSFSEILSDSIFKTIQVLLLLLGIITTFIIINTIIQKLFNLNQIYTGIISGLLEMTGGIKNISLLNIPLNIKASIITFFISFGGLSIHMQVMSILSKTKIKYFPYLLARIIHGLISGNVVYFILTFIY